jgi:hypothetical protein
MTSASGSTSAEYSQAEQEVIVLKAAWELISDMVNYEIFVPLANTKETSLLPNTVTHKRLFNILLLDFLSTPNAASFGLQTPPEGSALSDKTYLYYLRRIANEPQLNPSDGDLIAGPVEAFAQWLEAECFVEDVWLPSIDVKTDLRVKRIQFLRICGNIAKHNFASMSRNSKEIAAILEENGVSIDRDQRYLVIPDFYDWFHTNILSYHMSAIAEFLNNIRWGLYDYLRPEFMRSSTRDVPNPVMNHYEIPPNIHRPLGRTMYWDLMNEVRSKPHIPRFEVDRYLKMRY